MESGVEYADHRNIGHDLTACANAHHVCRIVQGREIRNGFDNVHDILINDNRLGELLTAMNYAMTDRIDLIHALNNAVLGIKHGVYDYADSFDMVFNVSNDLKALFPHGGLINYVGILDADTVNKSLGNDRFFLNIDQLILERRAACIDNKNLH